MNRTQKPVYCFIYDDAKHFYRATQSTNGTWVVTHDNQMYPLRHNPKNLKDTPVEFATNKKYFSMNRSINYPLDFTFDGAAILNSKYLLGKGFNEILYFAMFEWDDNGGVDGKYKLSYNGRFDFQSKTRDEKLATFTVPVVDDSGWGILSQNDDVEYAIDCSENNPKTIKVLFDDFTLKNRYTFQSVQAPITHNTVDNTYTIPFVLVNQDGDSAGLVTKSQILDMSPVQAVWGAPNTYASESLNQFMYSFFPISGVNIQGSFKFTWSIATGIPSGGLWIFFRTSTGQSRIIFTNQNTSVVPPGDLVGISPAQVAYNLVVGHTYNVDFNFDIDLEPGEKIFFMAQLNANAANNFTITPITTNIFVTTLTKAEAAVAFGLRPLDLLQEIVKKATLERYNIGSNFFVAHNKTILIPGDSIRGITDAKIYTSFRDFFESFSALFFMALRVVNGSLFMELADEVYKRDTNIIDLGELIECETSPATDYIPNELEVGSPKQDYRHPSGRLEFNAPSKFSFPFLNVKNKLDLKSKYRTDCYGIIFLLLDYRGGSTEDNSGDKSVFIVDVLDTQRSAFDNVETFENITVNNAPLAPIIKYPLSGEIIHNDNPLLKGVGIVGTDVNIYVNGVLDGSTVVGVDGTWEYQILTSLPSYDPGVFDGISLIQATNTDLGGATNDIQLIIDTTVVSDTGIIYPRPLDSLYNNKPLIKGVAPFGTNIDLYLDGVLLASVITDNSCKFSYKVVAPLTNASHNLSIGIGGTPVPFDVNSFVDFPLITECEGELDGFAIVNNLPFIKGVALPGVIVSLWLNYNANNPMGTTVSDANGNWEFHVIALSYPDPVSGIPVVLTPIPNGLNVISTLLVNNVVQISVTGFKLNRPNYNSITGVLDNTVFNTRFSNKRALLNHKSLLASIMNKQKNDVISYQTHDKNPNLRTVLGTEVVEERADIRYSELGHPLAVLENAKIKTIARKSFAATLYDFNNGGTLKGMFKGKAIYFLPIGSMKMKSIMDNVQEWELLISPQTTYFQLLNLYKNGLTINLMQNSIFHSDYNYLHIVEYNKATSTKYNFKEMYDDRFDSRNNAWIQGKTDYIQKSQRLDGPIRDQVITNGISGMTLKLYRCKDALLIDTIQYEPVAPAPITIPEVVMEAEFDWADYPSGQYFFVQFVGVTPIGISERIETRDKWPNTILIESRHSVNMTGIFFSTGFKTIIRVEGLVKKLQPDVDTVIAKEESGNTKLLWSQLAKKRIIRFGTARGLPDYLYLKVANALTNDNPSIEGVLYSLEEGEKITPSEDIEGVPLYYYNVNMTLQENSRGKVIAGQPGADISGVILIVDASAIGIPTDRIIYIQEE